ncbi:MAG: cytochrome c4 [Methylophilaceae bacterium]|nr:cytochrome c4 [Methylophilaceae bacterium]
MKFPAIALMLAGLLSMNAATAAEAAKAPAAKPEPTKSEAPKDAATLVNTVCAACHNADGNSVITANPRLAGQHAAYLAKQLRDFQSGKRASPVMAPLAATLTPQDITQLAAYFAAQKPKGGTAKENGPGSLGERIYRGGLAAKGVPACAACHGPNGAGIPIQFPRLSGQHAEYTVNQLKAFRSGERANAPMMKVIASKMTDEEIVAVSDYIQGLH